MRLLLQPCRPVFLLCSEIPRVTLTLKSAQMRGLILKDLDLGGNGRKVGRNVVFDAANTTHLARYLHALRVDDVKQKEPRDEIEEMEALIKRYSTFKKHVPGESPAPEGHVVVLTGSTGSLGAHILTLLLTRADVRKVYCLVRGENPKERVLEALRKRGLSVPDTTSLIALTSDLSRSDLGLSPANFTKLRGETTCIIHRYVAILDCAFLTGSKMLLSIMNSSRYEGALFRLCILVLSRTSRTR